MLIVGDVAGQYDTLMALVKKMPDDEVLLVGDLVDRGSKSKEVVDWARKNARVLLGNHEHLMLDYIRNMGLYYNGCWIVNGGKATLESYNRLVPADVLDWIGTLPLYYDDPKSGLFVSHAFVDQSVLFEDVCDVNEALITDENIIYTKQDRNIIWNRGTPTRMKDRFQVAGHNSHWGLRRFSDDQGEFAIGIDTSRSKILTGLQYPSMNIYQQEFV